MKNNLILFLAIISGSFVFANHITSIDKYNNIKVQPGYTIVEFGADWCSYCKKLEPAWDNLSKEFQHKAKFYKVNVDKVSEVTRSKDKGGEDIVGLPTIIFFKNGKEVSRERGGIDSEDLKKVINKFLSK